MDPEETAHMSKQIGNYLFAPQKHVAFANYRGPSRFFAAEDVRNSFFTCSSQILLYITQHLKMLGV